MMNLKKDLSNFIRWQNGKRTKYLIKKKEKNNTNRHLHVRIFWPSFHLQKIKSKKLTKIILHRKFKEKFKTYFF